MPSVVLVFNIALTKTDQNNCKCSSLQVLQQRACALSISWLRLGKAAMCQGQLAHRYGPRPGGSAGRHSVRLELQVLQQWSLLIYALTPMLQERSQRSPCVVV